MSRKLNPTKFTQATLVLSLVFWENMYRHRNNESEICIDVVQFRVTSATEGRVDFELDIQKEHTNRLQTLHGGTLASLVDLGGSLAVASSGRFATGVSTDLNGDVLKGTATLDKIGKTLAFTQVTFTNSKGQLAARGSHTKYVTGTMGEDGPFVAPAEFSDVD
ncbi:hypothetical protein BFJ68_g2676 [Fusarium oxysporum]|uniref:Thioesterase domain-containing protein n=1 Tax=Fusarium oxysporum TaxID=5507 RepID=A0A420RUH2_FUSOX|nr:hypothetical protein BFJ68_g2676 [Fusarium oxysporum]